MDHVTKLLQESNTPLGVNNTFSIILLVHILKSG